MEMTMGLGRLLPLVAGMVAFASLMYIIYVTIVRCNKKFYERYDMDNETEDLNVEELSRKHLQKEVSVGLLKPNNVAKKLL
mmetsp:Transcript_864/g.816  ORF Transcript_864/g.816 Transcript_864/m.816 type:complete len:81 (+) Transcript_864:1-243(+)